MTDDDLQTDRGWENRRLILASLAPRTTTRPARRSTAPDVADDHLPDDPAAPKKPGLLGRGVRAGGRAAAAGGRAFDNRVPRENRLRVAILTVAAVVVLLVALAFVNFVTADDVRMMREIEQFYSTQVEEMPMNVAGKHSKTSITRRTNTDKILQTLSKRQIHTNPHLPCFRSSSRLPLLRSARSGREA